MLEINCNKCANLSADLGGTSKCKVYGPDCEKATRACVADGFKNYTPGLKPERQDADHAEYFSARYLCPICMSYLASYSYGRSWTANGLYPDQLIDCPVCDQAIDWSDVPRAKVQAAMPEKEEPKT